MRWKSPVVQAGKCTVGGRSECMSFLLCLKKQRVKQLSPSAAVPVDWSDVSMESLGCGCAVHS